MSSNYDYKYVNALTDGLSTQVDDLLKAINVFDDGSIKIYLFSSNVLENAIRGYALKEGLFGKAALQNITYFDLLSSPEIVARFSEMRIDLNFIHALRKERNKQHQAAAQKSGACLTSEQILKGVFSILVALSKAVGKGLNCIEPTETEIHDLLEANSQISKNDTEKLNEVISSLEARALLAVENARKEIESQAAQKYVSKEEIKETLRQNKADVSVISDELKSLKEERAQDKANGIDAAEKNLKVAAERKYTSSEEIRSCALALKRVVGDNFLSKFYLVCLEGNATKLNELIDTFDPEENGHYINDVLDFVIGKYDLRKCNLIPLRNFRLCYRKRLIGS